MSECDSSTGRPKVRHKSKSDAKREVRRSFGGKRHNVYLCAECGFWHVGSAANDKAGIKAWARDRRMRS